MLRMIAITAIALSACASAPKETPSAPAMTRTLGAGYLSAGAVPDAGVFVPPPPIAGSAAEARDIEASKSGIAEMNTPRWRQAAIDADLVSGAGVSTFDCAAGVNIGEKNTPVLYRLLRKSAADFAQSTAGAKAKYQRARPFMINGLQICTPADEARLRGNGSYPSGHSAIGLGWGLVLAELLPERASALVARGRDFGDSRRVCNVHWLSDVEEGRIAAAATFARLQADSGFVADVAAAREEIARTAPASGCQ